MGFQMVGVAVGWQLYTLTGSALDLGLVGLAQFVPMILLTLVVGQVADRCDRRRVVTVCEGVKAAATATLAIGTIGGWQSKTSLLAVVAILGAGSERSRWPHCGWCSSRSSAASAPSRSIVTGAMFDNPRGRTAMWTRSMTTLPRGRCP